MRLHQSIAERLGTAILCGEHPPGAHLGGEIEATAALGVSRTAYREGLRILIAKGLLESQPRAGTHVTPRALEPARSRCAGVDVFVHAR